jgi:hypothetical protein
MREVVDQNPKDILSKATELTGEFKENDEFENLIREIDSEKTYNTKKRGRASVKETYYWPIVKQLAKLTGPLPKSSDRKTLGEVLL